MLGCGYEVSKVPKLYAVEKWRRHFTTLRLMLGVQRRDAYGDSEYPGEQRERNVRPN